MMTSLSFVDDYEPMGASEGVTSGVLTHVTLLRWGEVRRPARS